MEPSQERPTRPGRPSLLSADGPSESGSNRILGVLDEASGKVSGATRARRVNFGWLARCVAVLAVVAGASAWWTAHNHKIVVLASTVPAPSAPAPASAPVSAPGESDGDPMSTAAVLHDVPQAASASAPDQIENVRPPKEGSAALPPLVMLPAVVPDAQPTPVPAVAERVEKLQGPASDARAPGKDAVQATRASATKRAAEVQDSDVTLLAALVAHSKANESKRGTIAAKLKQCMALGTAAEVENCRARACAGNVNLSECHKVSAAKATDEA